jgi:hypothetical protein
MNVLGWFAAALLCGMSRDVVTVGEVPTVTVHAGDSSVAIVSFQIAEGFHVQANPASNEFLIPFSLTFTPGDSTVSAVPEYPEPYRFRLEGTTEDLSTYHGVTSLRIGIRVGADASAGERRLAGELRYQACDARRCYFPESIPVTITVVVDKLAPVRH